MALFIGPPGVGKSHEVLRLLREEYYQHFEKIVFICPTLTINETYIKTQFIWSDRNIYTIVPGDFGFTMIEWIDKLSKRLQGVSTLFIIDDCIADEGLDKTRSSLYDLAIATRHRKHTLFFLTQTYNGIPKRFRRLATMLFVWFLKGKGDQTDIAIENSQIDNWKEIFTKLRKDSSKHAFAYIRGEKPFSSQIING